MEQAQQQLDDNISTGFATPPLPSTASEFITALAHFHRAEIARMAGWRDRIDRTSNWAITGVAAMLSLSLSSPSSSHGVLLFAMIMILLLLLIEARRYRFFDVYRGRVRIIERNYFAQMFAPDSQVKEDWAKALGKDLREPEFLMSLQDGDVAPPAAQLCLDVPDPADGLGAEDLVAKAAGYRDPARRGRLVAGDRRKCRTRSAARAGSCCFSLPRSTHGSPMPHFCRAAGRTN